MNRDKIVRLLVSFFYCGYLPIAPGTWGSVPGVLLVWYFPGPVVVWATLGLCALGFLLCAPAQKVFNDPDPSHFVLDEVCGMMISVLWLPKRLVVFALAFLLFRILDVWKPWPMSYFDDSKKPSCIMWDDLVAGVFVNLILQGLVRLAVL